MVNMERIHEELGVSVCRRCICGKYQVDIQPKDCLYEPFPHECSCCGEIHNIVASLRTSGKMKLAFK